MESARVQVLLDRYFEGETSLAEELELRTYFTSDTVAPEFTEYVVLFSAFAKAQQETTSVSLDTLPKRTTIRPLRWLSGAAAVAVIAVGLYMNFGQQETFTTTYDSEELAILKTKQALGVMSQMLTQSTTKLEVVNEFDKASSTLFK